MKCVVISSYDVMSVGAWSGIPYFFTNALRRVYDQVIVGAPLEPRMTPASVARLDKARATGCHYTIHRDADVMRLRARSANALLGEHQDAEIVFVFHPPDAAFLETQVPVAIVHDATWRQYVDEYGAFLGGPFDLRNYSDGCALEKLALRNANVIVWFTKWASSRAEAEYPDLAEKMIVSLPGANLADTPEDSEIERFIELRRRNALRLLHIGREPYRKGLDTAVAAVAIARRHVLHAELHLAGVASVGLPSFCHLHNFIAKSSSLGASLISDLYERCSCFILPSRAECAGIVLCEAAAFGMPALTSGVGGTSEIVIDGVTGLVVRDNAPRSYADAAVAMFSDSDLYAKMSRAARQRFRDCLKWDVTIKVIRERLKTWPSRRGASD